MAIVQRLEDFRQGERLSYPRHERAKDGGDDPRYGRYYPHKGKMIAFLSKGDSSSSNREARMGALQMVNAFVQKLKEEVAKRKKSKKRWDLLYAMVDVAGKNQEVLVDTGATHNFMSPMVTEWLGLIPTRNGSWFTTVNAEERLMKGVFKNIDFKIDGCTGKADFNIIDIDELEVGDDDVGKEGQLEWMIQLVSKDEADALKGITVLQLDKGSTLCYGKRQMGPRTYAVDMLTKTVMTDKFKHELDSSSFLLSSRWPLTQNPLGIYIFLQTFIPSLTNAEVCGKERNQILEKDYRSQPRECYIQLLKDYQASALQHPPPQTLESAANSNEASEVLDPPEPKHHTVQLFEGLFRKNWIPLSSQPNFLKVMEIPF
ncbi:hypothetical protein RJ639_023627 [Escallonia herrerae]|uniref:Uncharacterized protein n=1 Tax=Escallonia herrerae TaxID=1293975 RepID=A0AA88V176_9ASTE|nr:hypothetical protein RJ639_023627 [Escallonia herrerae]